MWPSERVASTVFDWANIALVISLSVGAAATVLVVWTGSVKEDSLKERVAASDAIAKGAVRDAAAANEGLGRAQAAIESSKAQAARAEARVAEANLELAKLKAPRVLTDTQSEMLKRQLEKYAGNRFWVGFQSNDHDMGSEQALLAKQLVHAFEGAHWVLNDHLASIPTVVEGQFDPISDRGCNVATADDPKSLEVRAHVVSGLKSIGLDCVEHTAPGYLLGATVIEIGLR